MGRPPLTEQQAFLRGTRSKAQPVESTCRAGKAKPPSHLSADALAEWKRVSKILAARSVETPGDYAALAVYVETYARWIQAKGELGTALMIDEVVLDSNGAPFTKRKLNPLLKVISDCERRLLSQLKAMGLTPDSREKVKALKPDEGKLPPVPGTIGWMLINGHREQEPASESQTEGELADAV